MLLEGQMPYGHNGHADTLGDEMLTAIIERPAECGHAQHNWFASRPSLRGRSARPPVDLDPHQRELVALSAVLSEPDALLTTNDRVAALAGYKPASSGPRIEAAAKSVVEAMDDLIGRPPAEWSNRRSSLDVALAGLNAALTGRAG